MTYKILVLTLCMLSLCSHAKDVIRLEGISIQGSSEEPNVLFITPWQPAPGTGRLFSPVRSYRTHWLKPISRESFRREVKYLNYFQQNSLNTRSEIKK